MTNQILVLVKYKFHTGIYFKTGGQVEECIRSVDSHRSSKHCQLSSLLDRPSNCQRKNWRKERTKGKLGCFVIHVLCSSQNLRNLCVRYK